VDPNANLAEQRAIATKILGGANPFTTEDAWRLAELVAAMDTWLVSGGALPDDWSPHGHDEEG
jgi:hypothetical protein